MKKWLLLCCLCICMACSLPAFVLAHANVDQSSPQQESELQGSPKEIRISFTEEINANVSSLVLKTESGEVVPGTFRAEGKKTLVMPVSSLQNGIYRVEWQVLSVDTHVTEGSFRFAVGVPLPKHRPADTVSLDGDQTDEASQPPPTALPVQEQNAPVNQKSAPPAQTEQSGPPAAAAKSGGSKSEAKAATQTTSSEQGERKASVDGPRQQQNSGPSPIAAAGAGEQTSSAEAKNQSVENEQKPSVSEGSSDMAIQAGAVPASRVQTDAGQQPSAAEGNQRGAADTVGSTGESGVEVVADTFSSPEAHDHEAHEAWSRWLRMADVLVAGGLGVLVFLSRWEGFVSAFNTKWLHGRNVQLLIWLSLVFFALSGAVRIYLLADMLRLPGGLGENMLTLLRETMTGTIGWVRPLLCILLLLAVRYTDRFRWGSTGVAIALFCTFPLTGHAMAGQERFASMASDVLHMAAAVVWIGGLSGLTVLSFRLVMNSNGLIVMHKLMSQFAQLALYSVAVISGTGIVLGLLRFAQPRELVTTSYGLILSAKIGAFLLALIIAAFHRAKVMPRLAVLSGLREKDALRLAKKLSWTLRLELIVVLLALLLAGLLSATPPPIIR
ncbi:copper resistance protein CopC [Brevibacillus borstelensis]|uniref:copper resistance protein CopC n=1 Tax=Brevibacillus borstelensis TaxID=45462 RepID=UPI0030BC058E